jgi:hypothetical protein
VTQVSNVQQTAAFARRVVCRALTVVGGVAAGTAIAWWLSTSSASAEIEVPVDAPAAVQEVAAPVTQAVDATAQRLQDPPPPPKAALDDLGQKVTDAANKFRARTDLPKLPSCDNTVCLDNERHMYPFDGFGRSDLPSTPAPVATTVAPGIAVDALVPSTATERAFADGMSRRGSPAPVSPALPELPNWPAPLPFAPAGVPTTVNHGSAGNSSDSHLFAALPWQNRGVDLVAGGIAAATSSAAFGRVGAQPGVAPD